MSRFGNISFKKIDISVNESQPRNTVKTKKNIWKQFIQFCAEKKYTLDKSTSNENLALILKDWAFNMRKVNGEEYKESVIKTMWNVTAKLLQEKYMKEHQRIIDIFISPIFQQARDARNAKRKILQAVPEKRAQSAAALKDSEIEAMINVWDENTPEGLQIKFFLIASIELAWRGGEGASCLVHYFQEERENDGNLTGRLIYNPIFTKTNQGGSHTCAQNKYLIQNKNKAKCPIMLFKKLMEKRQKNQNIKTERLFLTPNPHWNKRQSSGWYKNMPVGIHEIGKWTSKSAELIGLDTTTKKITNHSNRATAVSSLAKAGIAEQQIIKITGHCSTHSIKPYLQLDQEHHQSILNQMRNVNNKQESYSQIDSSNTSNKKNTNVYNNCTFNCNNMYIN